MDFKSPDGIGEVRNGRIMNITMDEKSIGMPDQKFNPWEPLSEGAMRTSPASAKLFPNGTPPNEGGVVNKNGEYGPITYGF
jgi:hypothetical protein